MAEEKRNEGKKKVDIKFIVSTTFSIATFSVVAKFWSDVWMMGMERGRFVCLSAVERILHHGDSRKPRYGRLATRLYRSRYVPIYIYIYIVCVYGDAPGRT